MEKTEPDIKNFQKKIYTKLNKSDLDSLNLQDSISKTIPSSSQKKIIAISIENKIKEDLKKNFLPLLIEIFELRQMISLHRYQQEHKDLFPSSKTSLKEIIQRLETLKGEIEEAKRWCDSVSLQLEKGLQESHELQDPCSKKEPLPESFPRKRRAFLKNLMKLFHKKP